MLLPVQRRHGNSPIMKATPPELAALAIMLAALAGYVDAIAWLSMAGFFASFMSGNTTRLGVSLASGELPRATIALALILSFIAGVIGSSVVAHRFAARHEPSVMLLVTGLLVGAAIAGSMAPPGLVLVLLAAAMGAENGVFQREGEVSIGLTYVTGTFVRLGQRIAAALIGGGRWDWLPHLALVIGFAAGAVMGAHQQLTHGFAALWWAAAAAAGLTLLAAILTRRR